MSVPDGFYQTDSKHYLAFVHKQIEKEAA